MGGTEISRLKRTPSSLALLANRVLLENKQTNETTDQRQTQLKASIKQNLYKVAESCCIYL